MSYNPAGGGTYFLGSSIGSTDTTILLSSFLEPVSSIPYTMVLLNTDIVFATIAPGTPNSEFISFTGITQNANGTATLTGVTRGLAKKYPFTTSSTFKLPHSGQSLFILSDAPQVFNKYPAKANDETITGQWTFDLFPITPSNTPATTSALGVVKMASAPDSAGSPYAVGSNVLVPYAVDSVGTDSYAITPSPAIASYAAGQIFTFKAGTANTGAATLNVNGLGAKTIKKNSSSDLVTGDILANQIIMVQYDGTNMQLLSRTSPATDPVMNVYTGSGTWTKPAGLKYIIVEVQAGGGGGGGNTTVNTGSGGGGGGGYSRELILAASLGATETYIVGAGGTAGAGSGGTGGTGGTSSFGTSPFLSASGGLGGTNQSLGGTGGSGSNGALNVTGGPGNLGENSSLLGGGCGGSSHLGGGANGKKNDGANDAGPYGGGGGGAYSGGGGDTPGGAGGPGVVIVTEYYS